MIIECTPATGMVLYCLQHRRSIEMPKNGSNQPRWTHVVAAAVALAGLLWTIVSYFIPKPEVRPPEQPSTSTVRVNGDHSVGVGNMSGGQITTGSSMPASSKN
jgi:hypothetical protein